MIYRLVLLFIPTFLFVGCYDFDKENKEIREDFKKNHYNFNLNKTLKYEGISFKLPDHFKQNYSHTYTIKNSSLTRSSNAFNIYFSVERFNKSDLNREFVYDFVLADDDLLNTFQDAYVWRRFESLNNSGVSIKKELPKSFRNKGLIQTISGDGTYSGQTYYVTSTIKVKNDYYVFQWITSKPIMNYTYDDFERILKSVRKSK
ncbi:hypothetical protein [Fluviicola chungangensis]|uniref:Gliding motility lipoprotein GldD n=1 Tax=Fluviicola chungangensis TaxID=2597671 RepID=A0A556MK37_9FLAO|nr:hypothetical protein [Fluviicola chungangensis]TSJ40185.1 hypothetical protein FO442_16435 [Fluviicola chungangensis]